MLCGSNVGNDDGNSNNVGGGNGGGDDNDYTNDINIRMRMLFTFIP